MIKVKASELKDFVVKCTADGLIQDCVLNFTDKGLEMVHTDSQGVIYIAGLMDKKCFSEYENIKLEIKSTKPFINALATFKDSIINIHKKDLSAKIIDEDGGFDFSLAEKVVCVREGIPQLEYNNSIIIKQSLFNSLFSRNNIVKTDEVLVSISNKEVKFIIGKESDKAEVKTITTYEGELKEFYDWNYFKDLTSNLGLVFDMSVGKDGVPTKFTEKTDKFSIVYFLTPISEKKE
jgi:hypothetical protein